MEKKLAITRVYQNKDTLALDKFYGLNGAPVNTHPDVLEFASYNSRGIFLCNPYSNISTQVGKVVSSFICFGKSVGNFLGVREDELRGCLKKGFLEMFTEQDLDTAINFKDRVYGSNFSYIKKSEIDGGTVLFPSNLYLFKPKLASFPAITGRLIMNSFRRRA